ncbi:MAG: hypothetical protein ACK56F_11755, partial [bacterium]
GDFKGGTVLNIKKKKSCLRRRICTGCVANGERSGRAFWRASKRGVKTTCNFIATRSVRPRHPPS